MYNTTLWTNVAWKEQIQLDDTDKTPSEELCIKGSLYESKTLAYLSGVYCQVVRSSKVG